MKNKKNKIGFFVVLITSILFLRDWKEFKNTTVDAKAMKPFLEVKVAKHHSTKKITIEDDISESKQNNNIQKLRRIPSQIVREFKKGKIEDPFVEFQKHAIGTSIYEHVKGLHASYFIPIKGIEYREINGIYFSDAFSIKTATENVIFDKNNLKYGLWTGEISLKLSSGIVEEILDVYDLELLKRVGPLITLKANGSFLIGRDLINLEKMPGVEEVILDLKFSKLRRQ